MDLYDVKRFFRMKTTHRAPKLVTLALASTVLFAMVTYDAGAAPSSAGTAQAVAGKSTIATLAARWNGGHRSVWDPFGGTTTTTTPTASGSSGSGQGSTPTTQPPTTTITPPATNPSNSGANSGSNNNGGGGSTTTTQPTTTTTTPPTTPPATPSATGSYPVGDVSSANPSGMAPPDADALAGFNLSYETDFNGSSLPAGWETYSGQPGGDSGAQWSASHVSVGNGLLQLNAFEDPSYNNEWVTGGLCQCGVSQTYGAYFVRSRVTGAGPTNVELLWPTGSSWPPEIDFNETGGGTTGTSATVHYGSSNRTDQRTTGVDMTQWHTWGVIWTPTSITYAVDGSVWGSVTNTAEIPDQPMRLDIQQQTWCSSGFACPSSSQSMQIDWVAEYSLG